MSAIDVIAVRQEDNSLRFSPLFVWFGKKAHRNSAVEVFVNDVSAQNESKYRLVVKQGEKGATFETSEDTQQIISKSGSEDVAIQEELNLMHSMLIPRNFCELILMCSSIYLRNKF